jgi:hypothetical protein
VTDRVLSIAPALVALIGCAKGGTSSDPDAAGPTPDASCGDSCDSDGDGVTDGSDECPGTPPGEVVNSVGCSDAQVSPTLEPLFPPFNLTWTPTGDLGRAGGLTWTYTGIDRADLFHIYWIVCDDASTPCGLSLDGPIDAPGESWQFTAAGSDFVAGRLAYTSTPNLTLADTSTVALMGRLTITITDDAAQPLVAAPVTTLGTTGGTGVAGAEIPGTAFTVNVLAEVQDSTLVWTPYLDYYEAAPTPDPAPGTTVSFSGSFYSE